MASLRCVPAGCCITAFPCKNSRVSKILQVRAQSYGDEGRWKKNIVDSNLCILKERIEEVKMKETGWNYAALSTAPNFGTKKDRDLLQFGRLLGTLTATFGLTLFSCTFFLYIVSIWVHFKH